MSTKGLPEATRRESLETSKLCPGANNEILLLPRSQTFFRSFDSANLKQHGSNPASKRRKRLQAARATSAGKV